MADLAKFLPFKGNRGRGKRMSVDHGETQGTSPTEFKVGGR